MEPLERLMQPQTSQARERPVFGLVTARVRSIEDDGAYRLDFLTMGSDEPSAPARVMMPMAGASRGTYFFPEVGDEVVVAFELGNTNLPIILGAVWNADSPPPGQASPSPENNVRTIVSRSGHELTFDDSPGAEKVTLRTKGGHQLVLDDRPGLGKVTLETGGGRQLVLDDTPPGSATLRSAMGAAIELSDGGQSIRLSAPLQVQIQASTIMLQGTAIQIVTTGAPQSSAVLIDGRPWGLHTHSPPVIPGTPPITGPVAP